MTILFTDYIPTCSTKTAKNEVYLKDRIKLKIKVVSFKNLNLKCQLDFFSPSLFKMHAVTPKY